MSLAPSMENAKAASPLCPSRPNTKMSISPNATSVAAATIRRLVADGTLVPVTAATAVIRSTPSRLPPSRRLAPSGVGTPPG